VYIYHSDVKYAAYVFVRVWLPEDGYNVTPIWEKGVDLPPNLVQTLL